MAKLARYGKVKYEFQKETVVPGTYTLHRPSKCNLKFPKDQRPIHKKLSSALEGKELVKVPQNGKWRSLIVKTGDRNIYPAIWPKEKYEKLKEQAKIVTLQERLAAVKAADDAHRQMLEDCEQRKLFLKKAQQKQPGQIMTGDKDEAPDQDAFTMQRSTDLKNEEFQAPRLANQIILASKCHAIRDAQIVEKALIKKELEERERKLDEMMERDRVAAIEKSENEWKERKSRRLENVNNIKKQILENDKAKVLLAERIYNESVKMNQLSIEIQMDEINALRKKKEKSDQLKELLDKCNEEIMYARQLKEEEERLNDERVKRFMRQKQEREAKQKADADAAKAARDKGIDIISKAQKAEQELHEELEMIRNLKIQEDVEKEFRRKEKEAALNRKKNLQHLKESREKQISHIRKQISLEIARDEAMFFAIVKQNKEDLRKEYEEKMDHHAAVQRHRQDIIKQINDKERERINLRERMGEEGMALRLEMERQEKLEKSIVRGKVQQMRAQKVPEVYVAEVEQKLKKLKIY